MRKWVLPARKPFPVTRHVPKRRCVSLRACMCVGVSTCEGREGLLQGLSEDSERVLSMLVQGLDACRCCMMAVHVRVPGPLHGMQGRQRLGAMQANHA